MPFHCPVCDNDEYDEQDGLFFCSECGTQSREHIVTESEEVPIESSQAFHRVASLPSQDVAQSQQAVEKLIKGRPWTIYEGFQHIIAAQAEALVKLGADVTLQETVFTIWANYLSKLGVAFSRKEKVVPDIVMKSQTGRLRELHRGSFESPINKMFSSVRTSKRSRLGDCSPHAGCEEIDEEEMRERKRQKLEEDIIKVEEGFIEEKPDYIDRKIAKPNLKKEPQWMCMPKTLAICYIGMMVTNPSILPCDVVRWAYQGKIPYFSATKEFPEDMMLSSWDEAAYESDIDYASLMLQVNKLLTYLGLTQKHFSVNRVDVLIKKFIDDLYLPHVLKKVCLNVVEEVKQTRLISTNVYINQELLAMAYVVLAVKMVFGLDGKKEKKLSECSRQIGELLGPDVNVFVWESWKKFHVNKSRSEFCAFKENCKDITASKLDDLDALLQSYLSLERDKKKIPPNRMAPGISSADPDCIYRYRRATADFDVALQRPLDDALRQLEQSKVQKRSIAVELNSRGRQFQTSSIAHIVDAAKFLQNVQPDDHRKKSQLKKLLRQQQLCDSLQLSSQMP